MSDLPDWVPKEEWRGFVEMRKKTKYPLNTERAINLNIATLLKLKNEGHDPVDVLNQSVMNGYRGLFPIQERRSEPRPGQRASFPALGKHGQATANNLQDWLEDFT